jgi:hypothetical protein
MTFPRSVIYHNQASAPLLPGAGSKDLLPQLAVAARAGRLRTGKDEQTAVKGRAGAHNKTESRP